MGGGGQIPPCLKGLGKTLLCGEKNASSDQMENLFLQVASNDQILPDTWLKGFGYFVTPPVKYLAATCTQD